MLKETEYACNFKTSARKLNRIKINDLLSNANEANEEKIFSSIPKFRTDLKAPDISSAESRIDEDDSICILKTTLESLVKEDKELEEYYNGLQSRLNKKKIDEIYSIVTANIPFEPIRRAHARAATKSYTLKEKHSGKKESLQKNHTFVQETLEDLNDIHEITSLTLAETEIETQEDDLNIINNDVDPSQITLDMLMDVSEKNEEDEHNLKIAFDMINNEGDFKENDEESNESIFSKLFKYRPSTAETRVITESENNSEDYEGFEFTTRGQKHEGEVLLKKAVSRALKKLLCSLVLFALVLGLQIAPQISSEFENYISYKSYGFIYSCVQLQLLFLTLWLLFNNFISGIKGIATGKLRPDSAFAVTLIIASIHNIFTLFNLDNGVVLFNIVPIFMSVCSCLGSYLKAKKDLYCFSVVSSEKTKFVASELSSESKEASSFFSYLFEDSDIYTVGKTQNVSSFFKRISVRPKSEDILGAIIPGVFFVSAIIYAICIFHGKMSLFDAFTSATAFICTAMPSTIFFVITLPLFFANRSCKKIESAIIGDGAAEEYSTASVISFEDTELFPSDRVKMTNIKTYYNARMDQVIVELAKLFSYLGGPLKPIFADAVSGMFEEHSVIRIIESAENGVMIAADGVDYYLGSGAFMRSHSIVYEDDPTDEVYERNGGSVMLFGANNLVVAKVYFKYKPQKGFKKLLSHMYECGLCVGIKTLDPNINNSLLNFHADGSPCPISILKSSCPEEISAVSDKVDTGIVSTRSLGAFLKAFMYCDKARHSIKSNGIVMLASCVLVSILMIFISFTGSISDFSPTHAILFQILWSTVVWILSFLK